ESIGFEKAGIMRAGRPVVVSDPLPPTSIEQHANAIGADLWLAGRDFSLTGVAGSERLQWGWSASAERGGRRYSGLAYPALRGANQLVNAAGVLAALTAMRERLPVSAQALRGGLSLVELPGRFQLLPGQPAVVLDVAHNPHAVAALTANLDAMGFYPVTHAVFGAMADKDLPTMLRRIGPLVDRWYFCDLPTPRAAKSGDLKVMFDALDNPAKATARCFANPLEAYAAAVAESTSADRIIVFGSFVTVGAVMAANGH
ncbi:MAG: bifunctional folylpolyglutamate synthase/dihydrofolate synthase, partial [Burkholderiaceae bacterium]